LRTFWHRHYGGDCSKWDGPKEVAFRQHFRHSFQFVVITISDGTTSGLAELAVPIVLSRGAVVAVCAMADTAGRAVLRQG
jgi:hypothetical protein